MHEKIFKQLIIGNGEVGQSLYQYLLLQKQNVQIRDKENNSKLQHYDIIHICYGYSTEFVQHSKEYIKQYSPTYTIAHSTVPIGTCKQINAIHSPVRGIHPHLAKSIETFVKYFGGMQIDKELTQWIEATFDNYHIVNDSNVTEALKLWSTTQYGLMILLEKEIHAFCKNHNLPFDIIYSDSNETYNEGYEKLGFPQYTKPILKEHPGKIGGHCVIQNCELLNSYITKLIIEQNKKLN